MSVGLLYRWTLWNLNDILRHVESPDRTVNIYPTQNLKLPLLTFEMMECRAVPPNAFEENGMFQILLLS